MSGRTCTVDDCERKHAAHGLCLLHYKRARRAGTIPPPQRLSVTDRFWSKVDRSGGPDACWLWTAFRRTDTGYGEFYFDRRNQLAHRFSYQLQNGPIPVGLEVDHKCHVPACVNPAHLQAVTTAQNQENRGANKGSRSGVRGVSWSASRGKWVARVSRGEKVHWGGYHETLEEAEQAAIALRNSLMTNNLLDRAWSA